MNLGGARFQSAECRPGGGDAGLVDALGPHRGLCGPGGACPGTRPRDNLPGGKRNQYEYRKDGNQLHCGLPVSVSVSHGFTLGTKVCQAGYTSVAPVCQRNRCSAQNAVGSADCTRMKEPPISSPRQWIRRTAFVVAVVSSQLASAEPPATGWVTDGPVNALTRGKDGTIYAGGAFELLAPRSGPLATLQAPSGVPRAGLPELAGTVAAIRPDGTGGWFVGGQFVVAERTQFQNLIHVNADATLDSSWAPNPNGAVSSLATTATTVFAGGAFTQAGATKKSGGRLAAIARSTGDALPGWEGGYTGDVLALSLSTKEDILYVGGAFTQPRSRLSAVTVATGALNAAFTATADAPVRALALADTDTLIVGGAFSQVSGAPRARLAAVDAKTGGALPLNTPADDEVAAIAVIGETIFTGGRFTQIGGQPRSGLAALSLSTGGLLPWAPNPAGSERPSVASLAESNGLLMVGGDFAAIGNQSPQPIHRRFAGLNPVTGEAASWTPWVTGVVSAVGTGPRGAVALGGTFGGVGGVARRNLAALNPATGAPTAFNPGTDGVVRALANVGQRLVVGGSFSSLGGLPRAHLGVVDTKTGTTTPWNPGADGDVATLLSIGPSIVVGGQFATLGAAARSHLGSVDTATGAVTAWQPQPDGDVTSLASADGTTVLAGGAFTSIGAEGTRANRRGLAVIDGATGAPTAWDAAAGPVAGTAATAARVVLSGTFTAVGTPSTPRAGLALIDSATAAPDPFTPPAGLSPGPVAIDDLATYAAGPATLAAFHSGQSTPVWKATPVGGEPRALLLTGDSLWVSGAFIGVEGRNQQGIARFSRPVVPPGPVTKSFPFVEGGARARVGSLLRCHTGDWQGVPTLSVAWLRDGDLIPAASDVTFRVTWDDVGRTVGCSVTGTDRLGTTTVGSPPSDPVAANYRVPDLRAIPDPRVIRLGDALVIVPSSIARVSAARPRLVAVRLQSARAGTVRIRFASGRNSVRFPAGGGRATVVLRAAAAFAPGAQRIPVIAEARLLRQPRRMERQWVALRP